MSRNVSYKSWKYPGNDFEKRWVFQSLAECGQQLSRRYARASRSSLGAELQTRFQ